MKKIEEYIQLSKNDRQSHIDLRDPCHIRGGDSIQFRGLLAYYLNTDIPKARIAICCHACHNANCSNPKHLYWGTVSENRLDFLSTCSDEYIKNIKNKGSHNHNYRKLPWLNASALPNSWIYADIVYDYIQNNIDDSGKLRWGTGASVIHKKFNIPYGTAKCIVVKVKGGWNPREDKDWLDFKNKGV